MPYESSATIALVPYRFIIAAIFTWNGISNLSVVLGAATVVVIQDGCQTLEVV